MRKFLLLIILLIGTPLSSWLQAQQVKVVSFNVHNNSNPRNDGNNTWNQRAKAVIEMIKKEQPDIIGTQEALLDQLSYIDRKFYDQYRRVGVSRDNGITRGEHAAIYYDKNKFKLIDHKTRWLSETPQRVSFGWDATEKHIVTVIHLQHIESGKDFYYFNTQIDEKGERSRIESLKLLAEMIRTTVPEGTPVILGGDMCSNIISGEFDVLDEIGMEVARNIATRTDYRNTYNAFGKDGAGMNDHFFVRNLIINRFRTINKSYGVPYISDHYPIEITITL